LRTIDGTIAEVNLNEGLLKRKHTEYREWTYSVSDHCMGYLIGVNKQNVMCFMEKSVEKGRWEKKNEVKIALKGEIIGLGVIAS
jgi:phosphoglycerate dehydrogenase-like enzyme